MKYKIVELRKPNYLNGRETFTIIEFIVDFSSEDKELLEKIKIQIEEMNTNKKNTSGEIRDEITLIKDKYLGIMSEKILTVFLNKHFEEKNIPFRAINEKFVNYDKHVDIIIKDLRDTNKNYKIEVRGSYPYKSKEETIWRNLSILGPYTTSYKSEEVEKDFYFFVFINCKKEEFDLKTKHSIYFAGGASLELFKKIGKIQSLKQDGADYRTIKPISLGYDSLEILKKIGEKSL